MSGSASPLGNLPGLTWDPIKKRYFPTPKQPQPVAGPSRPMQPVVLQGRPRIAVGVGSHGVASKRRCVDVHESGMQVFHEGASRRNKGGWRRREVGGYGKQDKGSRVHEEYLSGLAYEGSETCCPCHHERINTLQTYNGGGYLAATDHGKVLMKGQDGEAYKVEVCSDPIVGIPQDLARMTTMTISGGDNPHMHVFRRDPETIDMIISNTFDLDKLSGEDIQCSASYDDICVLGTHRNLATVINYDQPTIINRKLPSDPLAIDFGTDRNVVYAGMRNSTVILADLRTPSVQPTALCRMPGGKAVVGVKRLDDGAVPFGLVASAMGNELLIYDTRFGSSPLHTLPEHINTYLFTVSLATSPDSRFLFASGSDKRIGLWSAITGERLHPTLQAGDRGQPAKNISNPLARVFPGVVQKMSVREDMGLEVACGGELMHFGRATEGDEWDDEESEDMDWV